MYLVDTDVLSELRKRKRNLNVVAWLGAVISTDLFVRTRTIGEIELGIERQRTINPRFAEALADWLDLAIAGTALQHALIVVTRNVSDFQPTGVPILNPFNPQPYRKA